ncbi:peroxidase 11-like [Rhodamnia argentea]|uniref:Peroxidase n=1 Tax=Rhodamnia argentea TaxID=178133 RepID=A0A8B8QUL6_9MYRT|nr:peroxidase 11-like [Rhodamnia argentea]
MAAPIRPRIPATQFLAAIAFVSAILRSGASDPPLTLDHYASSCPTVFENIRKEMEREVLSDPRSAALVVRLHFHDCFVQGCDGSVLLDDTVMLQGEKTASPNINSLKGFEIIDRIKSKIESDCPRIVSCADILTIAARDAVILVGGPYWDVPVGRKDSRSASYELANTNIPTPNQGLISVISKFLYLGLSITDTVALSGAHTIGMARCENFRARIYGDYELTSGGSPLSEVHLSKLKSACPAAGGGEDNIEPLDYATPYTFDNSYYHLLLNGEGLLNSDQELYSSILAIQTKKLVEQYAFDTGAFFRQFSDSMVKMGNLTNPDSFLQGEVRKNCRLINA